MRYNDRLETAKGMNHVNGILVNKGYQVPQDVASGCLDELGAVANCEFGFGADRPHIGFVLVLPPNVSMMTAELEEGGEHLACCGDILARVIADFARALVGLSLDGVLSATFIAQ